MIWRRLTGFPLDLAGALEPRFAYETASGHARAAGVGGRKSSATTKVLIGLVLAGFGVLQYYNRTPVETNEYTGRTQRLALTPKEEKQLGLASRTEVAGMHGGISPDVEARGVLNRVGRRIVTAIHADESDYRFDFHLLADRRVSNAFAMPGGQIFVTEALYRMLATEDEIAGLLAHEIAHVVSRHNSERIAESEPPGGHSMAEILSTSDGQGKGSPELSALIQSAVGITYTQQDESECDKLAVKFLMQSGYNPEALIRLMESLRQAGEGEGGDPSKFLVTHPAPEDRTALIKAEIARLQKEGTVDHEVP